MRAALTAPHAGELDAAAPAQRHLPPHAAMRRQRLYFTLRYLSYAAPPLFFTPFYDAERFAARRCHLSRLLRFHAALIFC